MMLSSNAALPNDSDQAIPSPRYKADTTVANHMPPENYKSGNTVRNES